MIWLLYLASIFLSWWLFRLLLIVSDDTADCWPVTMFPLVMLTPLGNVVVPLFLVLIEASASESDWWRWFWRLPR